MNDSIVAQRRVSPTTSLIDALQQMDTERVRLLFMMDGEKLLDLVSIGDIQRAIIAKTDLDQPLRSINIGTKIIANESTPLEKIKETMVDLRLECMPIIDKRTRALKNTLIWDDVFSEKQKGRDINLKVVIMAGGVGSRLKPITNIIPKPLIPIRDKAIIHDIMLRFEDYNCKDFLLSVNYKADMIVDYFNSADHPYKITYFKENSPTGTAGSLSLMRDCLHETFFVINCDILIEEDYYEILDYHRRNINELTVVSVMKNYTIPYGVINTSKNGVLTFIDEKPNYRFQINSGMYILEPHVLDEIPSNSFFHITQLIHKIISRKGRVGVFPVNSGAWFDIGEWDELLNTYRNIGYIQ